MLAVGGQLKGTFALGRGRHAFRQPSPRRSRSLRRLSGFRQGSGLYEELFAIKPQLLVHDLHPDYASTRYARERAARPKALPLLAVQHHHAHMASCMAEHGLTEPVIGVSFDGTGYGTDGAIWGGEFLVGDYRQFRRAAHLRYVGMPGGDQAIREPWRMALAHLLDAGGDRRDRCWQARCRQSALRTVRQMLERGFNTPLTSSAGRLFDAVAALAGVRDRVSYEGQAAIELEWLAAERRRRHGAYPLGRSGNDAERKPSGHRHPAAHSRPSPTMSARARAARHRPAISYDDGGADRRRLSTVCGKRPGSNAVVLSGGVFMNALLTREAMQRLTRQPAFASIAIDQVPPNDGGLSSGTAGHRGGAQIADHALRDRTRRC